MPRQYARGARRCLAVAMVLASSCSSDEQTEPSDRRIESQIYIALAWDDLTTDERQLVCDLDAADLKVFLDGLALADGDPPDTDAVADFLAESC